MHRSVEVTHEMIKEAYGDGGMGRLSVFWVAQTVPRRQREGVEDDERSGRSSSSTTDENMLRVKNLLNSDRTMNSRMITDDLGIPEAHVFEIVKEDLVVRKACESEGLDEVTKGQPKSQDVLHQDRRFFARPFLFPRIKSKLKATHHGSAMRELNSILVQAYLETYENRQTRLQQCVAAEECFFEKF